MSFGENLSYLRRNFKITQEELAERVSVTRQTVSRWETDAAFPEVDTLIKLCDIFECNMDTLVRGNIESEGGDSQVVNSCKRCDLASYDKHMNRFSFLIALGVGLILMGVFSLVFTISLFNNDILGIVFLLVFVMIAVAIFIPCGITHHEFMKENPKMDSYPEEKKKGFIKPFAIMISVATSIILLGIITVILCLYDESYLPSVFSSREAYEGVITSILIFLIGISCFIYVYAGIQHSKYDTKAYNEECINEGFAQGEVEASKKSKLDKLNDTLSSVIMLSALILFLLLGFIGDLWHPAWIAFPIGGILCGITSSIISAIKK